MNTRRRSMRVSAVLAWAALLMAATGCTSSSPQANTPAATAMSMTQLAGEIPAEIGTHPMQIWGEWNGDELISTLPEPSWIEFATPLPSSDVSVVLARGGALDEFVSIFVVQVRGYLGTELLNRYESAMQATSDSPVEFDQTTVSGKAVEVGNGTYLYASGQLLFVIDSSSDELAAEAVSKVE